MILFPNAKINLGLNVLFKREDSFHELLSCMYPIPFCDVLEILPAATFTFYQSGLPIPGTIENNLCVKAYELMHAQFNIDPISIHLRKEIPMGGGLGGGSSDAAFVIKGINALFHLNLSVEAMQNLAAKLGSDCPFFIENNAQIIRGRGEILEPFELDLKGYYLKFVFPGIHVSTKDAFEGIQLNAERNFLKDLTIDNIKNWRHSIHNDFELSIFKKHPELAQFKSNLYEQGAVYASMSGSGSTLFGIFDTLPQTLTSNNEMIVPL